MTPAPRARCPRPRHGAPSQTRPRPTRRSRLSSRSTRCCETPSPDEGLERIDAVGVPFDPTVHDAVGHMPPARARRDGPRTPRHRRKDAPGAGPRHTSKPAKAAKAAADSGPPWPGHARRVPDEVEGLRPAMVLVGTGSAMAPQRDWYTTDYYKVLGVSDDRDRQGAAPRLQKARQAVPPGLQPRLRRALQGGLAAYDVLGDADKRKEYDEVRRLGPLSNLGGFGGGGGGQRRLQLPHRRPVGHLRRALRRAPGAGGAPRPGTGPRRGRDLEAELHLSFQEAVDGVVTTVNVTSGTRCSTCGGSGSRPGSSPVMCPRCGGLGVLNDNQGMFSLSSPCPECQGRGTGRRPRARAATGPASSSASARSRSASRPGSRTASASGSKAAAAGGQRRSDR